MAAAVGLALLVLYGGWLGYSAAHSVVSLASGCCLALLLLALAALARRAVAYEYAAVVVNFLTAIYFAYRLIVSERILPSGVLLVLSFLFLFLMLLGIFLDLSRAR